MTDLKRLILPAIVALVLHGFLVSFKLPKHQTLPPVLKGNQIQIEIQSFSPRAVVPNKSKDNKKVEIKQNAEAQEMSSLQKAISQTPFISKQQKKIIEPKRTEKKIKKQLVNSTETVSKVKIEKNIEKGRVAAEQTDNVENEVEKYPGKEKKPLAPIHNKAIPIYRQNKQPLYPVMARRRGYEGKVVLNVLVDIKGMVSEIIIKHPSGHLSLDRAALQSVKRWLFTPATEDGRPVAMWVDVPIHFQLK